MKMPEDANTTSPSSSALDEDDNLLQNFPFFDLPFLDLPATLVFQPRSPLMFLDPEFPSAEGENLLSTSLHTPERPDLRISQEEQGVKMEVVTSTQSTDFPVMQNGCHVRNLCEFGSNDDLSLVPHTSTAPPGLPPPPHAISLTPWPGLLNFRASIPVPDQKYEGPKSKWCYSVITERLYVAKDVAFPVSISMSNYPPGATLVVCPVYTESSFLILPVRRCPNCMMKDTNAALQNHVLRIEGGSGVKPHYFMQEDRYKFSVPLGGPAPGDSEMTVFLKVACNTSCTGGPNRTLFSALLLVMLRDNEIGRQVIDIKCCAGPVRDRGNDEKREQASSQGVDASSQAGPRVAIEPPNPQSKKQSKRKTDGESERRVVKKETEQRYRGVRRVVFKDEECVVLKIPKEYVKKVKKFVNLLYISENAKELPFETIYSQSSDTDYN